MTRSLDALGGVMSYECQPAQLSPLVGKSTISSESWPHWLLSNQVFAMPIGKSPWPPLSLLIGVNAAPVVACTVIWLIARTVASWVGIAPLAVSSRRDVTLTILTASLVSVKAPVAGSYLPIFRSVSGTSSDLPPALLKPM